MITRLLHKQTVYLSIYLVAARLPSSLTGVIYFLARIIRVGLRSHLNLGTLEGYVNPEIIADNVNFNADGLGNRCVNTVKSREG